ncbi:hypothetical protein MAPG_09110 [Magnaporthiopsis poae ATCC 64411]|uniref:Nephrocystin 3-like N-terminal domain-containing protein n=1 Tax=Magnaporthiopsis poae (strain ATCC 64411 / 73-15) TaxID=644358 RepID=A0A0C4E933_MAGP6|nr:hypothetical protein MAPG_09110 [Magnaporthiopsis poae ATCC 64411]
MPGGNLGDYASAVEKVVANKLEGSKTVKVAAWLEPLVGVVEMVKPFENALQEVYPPAGMILGGVVWVLKLSGSFSKYQEALLGALHRMADAIRVIDGYKSVFPSTPEMQLALMEVYGDILKFCSQASRPFLRKSGKTKSTAHILISSQLKSFETEFEPIQRSLIQHLDDFDRVVRLVLGQMSTQIWQEQMASREDQHRTFEAVISSEQNRQQQEHQRLAAEERQNQESRRAQLLSWISEVSFQDIQDHKLDAILPGTGQWLLNHPSFLEWKSRGTQGGGVLSILGKHGSGKSHLAALVIQDLEEHRISLQNSTGAALAYVYCSAQWKINAADGAKGYHGDGSAVNLLFRSILRQLYQQLPLDKDVASIRDSCFQRKDQQPRREVVRNSILELASELGGIFIVVDGLDECSSFGDSEFEMLCQFIASLGSKDRCSIVVLNRPGYAVIESTLGCFPHIRVDEGANSGDIASFVASKTLAIRIKSQSSLHAIQGTLQEKADGMFLWVSLVVDSIKKEVTDNKKVKALTKMPKDLSGAYQISLERIILQSESSCSLGLKALLWVANSIRRLSRRELHEALVVEEGMDEVTESDRLDEDCSMVEQCADLLILRDNSYELVHSSLGDYLRSLVQAKEVESLRAFVELQARAHSIMAETCLTYLLFEAFNDASLTLKNLSQLPDEYPLLEYASFGWGEHLARAAPEDTDLLRLALAFIRRTSARELSMHYSCHWKRDQRGFCSLRSKGSIKACGHSGKSSPLHLASRVGVVPLLELLDDEEAPIEWPDGEGEYPADYAMYYEKEAAMNWIVDKHERNLPKGSSRAIKSSSVLTNQSVINGWLDMLQRLLKLGHDKDGTDCEGMSPILFAVKHGSQSALDILLAAGADVNRADNEGYTPLIVAALNCETIPSSVITTLLCHNADVNASTLEGDTALLTLSGEPTDSAVEAAKELIRRGANVDWINSIGVDALCRCCLLDGTTVKMLQMLCQNGAKVNRAADDNRATAPLGCAIEKGRGDMVDALLSNGADITAAIGIRMGTALHFAIEEGAHQIIPTLLEAGKGTNWMEYKDKLGRTPLHCAAEAGDYATVQLLLGLDSQSEAPPDTYNRWPIHAAAEGGSVPCLEALCTQSNIEQPGDWNSRTPLFFAACRGALNNVCFLLGRGAAVDGANPQWTPLMAASARGYTETARTLIKHHENIEASRGVKLHVPFTLAAKTGNRSLCHALLEAGGDPFLGNPEDGKCAFHWGVDALQQRSIDIFLAWAVHSTELSRRTTVTNVLRLLHAPIPVGDSGTWTRLMDFYTSTGIINRRVKRRHLRSAFGQAVHSGRPEMLMPILEAMKKPSPQKLELVLNGTGGPNDRTSPLAFALGRFDLSTVKALVRAGASVDTPLPFGQTAVHHAAMQGFTDAVRILLDAGADPTRPDEFGLCATDYGRPFPTVMAIFESRGYLANQPPTSQYPTPSMIFSSLRKLRGENSTSIPSGFPKDPSISNTLRLLPADIIGPYLPAFGPLRCEVTDHNFDASHQTRYCCPMCPTVNVCQDCYHEDSGAGPRIVRPEWLGSLHDDLEANLALASRAALALPRAPGFRSGGGRFLHRMVQATWLDTWAEQKLAEYEKLCKDLDWEPGAARGKPHGTRFLKLLVRAARNGYSSENPLLEAPFDPWINVSGDIRVTLADVGGNFSIKGSRETTRDVSICICANDRGHSLIPVEPVPPFGDDREKYVDKRGIPTEALLHIWENKLGPERMNLPRGGRGPLGKAGTIPDGARVGGQRSLRDLDALRKIRGKLLKAWSKETRRRASAVKSGEEAPQEEKEDDALVVYEAAWYIAQVVFDGPDLEHYSRLQELVQDDDDDDDDSDGDDGDDDDDDDDENNDDDDDDDGGSV